MRKGARLIEESAKAIQNQEVAITHDKSLLGLHVLSNGEVAPKTSKLKMLGIDRSMQIAALKFVETRRAGCRGID